PIKGQKAEKPLKTEGMVRFECDAHGWMRGYVYVADNPYYAVTAKNGTFSLPEVPPGSYTLVAWQEYAGETDIPVTVEANKVAQAAQTSFRFAWVSDTHMYPREVNTRFVEKTIRAFKEVQAMNPPADFLIIGGDIGQLGDPVELELGAELLKEVKTKKVYIPG